MPSNKTTDDLSLRDMEAAWAAREEQLYQDTYADDSGLDGDKHDREEIEHGMKVLERYTCVFGAACNPPFHNGAPADPEAREADAWYLAAISPTYDMNRPTTYHFIRFHKR